MGTRGVVKGDITRKTTAFARRLDACEARGVRLSGRIAHLQALDVNWTHWPTYAGRVKDLAERRDARSPSGGFR